MDSTYGHDAPAWTSMHARSGVTMDRVRDRAWVWWRGVGEPWRTTGVVLLAVLLFVVWAIRT